MVKISYNPKFIHKNPIKAYSEFRQKIVTNVNKQQQISCDSFYAEFKTFTEVFEQNKKTQELNTISRSLIEFLVNKNQDHLAGIAYSVLIKMNENNPKAVEELALKALAIATRFNDPVHKMARANDLVNIYSKSERGSERHVKYLRIANRALMDICKNYNRSIKDRYKSISRKLAPLEKYELLLCNTKLKIAKYTAENEISNARYELEEAKKLFKKNKNSSLEESVRILSWEIAKVECKISKIEANKKS